MSSRRRIWKLTSVLRISREVSWLNSTSKRRARWFWWDREWIQRLWWTSISSTIKFDREMGKRNGYPFMISSSFLLQMYLFIWNRSSICFIFPEPLVDIVYPDSKRCCCFTKSYYRYVKGTGSLLATVQVCSSVEFYNIVFLYSLVQMKCLSWIYDHTAKSQGEGILFERATA